MPIRTEHYALEAFLDGDSYVAVSDFRRFSTVDNQLNKIAEISGNGVIDGWEAQEGSIFPFITVTAGRGFINKFYVTTFGDKDFEISANGTFHIYAQQRSGIIGLSGRKSDVVSISYNDAGVPAQPTGFHLNIDSTTGTWVSPFIINLSWNANTEVDLDHYELEYSIDGITYVILDNNINKSLLSYEDEVDEDINNFYQLYAVDQSNNRSISALDTIFTPISTILPPNPVEVIVSAAESSINILWKRPPNINFDKIAMWVITWVELNTNGTENISTLSSRIVNKNLYYDRLDDLSIGIQYKITIQSQDVKSRLSSGIEKIVTPEPSQSPRDPQGIAYSMEPDSEGVKVNLSWVSGETPYDPLLSYKFIIYTTIDGKPESIGRSVAPGETQKSISLYQLPGEGNVWHSIPESTLVTFRITAVSGPPHSGFESFGNNIRFETATFTLPTRLGNVKSSFDSDNGVIIVTWTNQSDTNSVNISVTSDDLEDAYQIENEIIDVLLVDNETSYAFDVTINRQYTIFVTPFNINNVSGPVSTVIELTNVGAALDLPEMPSKLNAQVGDGEIKLNWLGSSTLYTVKYNIYKHVGNISLVSSDWSIIDSLPSSLDTFTDFGLNNDQVYSYYITSVDIYGRESLHLPDDVINLNFVEVTPLSSGLLTEPFNVQTTLLGTQVFVSWESITEEFDGFTIYRSINNLHEWKSIATVDNRTLSYTDIELTMIDGTIFYYMVDKCVNDSDIIVQTSNIAPDSSIYLSKIVVGSSSISSIDNSVRRTVANLSDPIKEYTNTFLLPHVHRELTLFDPERIDLNPELIVTDWTTVDGRIFTTEERDITGSSYIVKIDNRFPSIFFQIDASTKRLIFSEPIIPFDEETGTLLGVIPEIEVRVIGIEEVQNTLDKSRFNNFHARQIQFGSLNKDQIPELGHEGRIRETLLPDRFSLERYSNHTFMPIEGTSDSSKTFGDGTTFFAVIDADGKIEEVIDFDVEDDGDQVGFRNPAFSDTTIQHLKQNFIISNLSSGNDNSHQYLFKNKYDFVSFASSDSDSGSLYVRSSNTFTKIGSIDSSAEVTGMTFDENNNILYCILDSSTLVSIDAATGEQISSSSISGDAATITKIEVANGIIYGRLSSTLYTISTSGVTSTVATIANLGVRDMAYVPSEGNMYVASGAAGRQLRIMNLSDGTTDTTHGTITNHSSDIMWYRKNTGGSSSDVADRLYFVSNNSENALVRIDNRTSTAITDLIDPTARVMSAARTANENFWLPNPNQFRMGDYIGLTTASFLRFQINVPATASPSVSIIHFTAFSSFASSGNQVRLRVSILDPSGFSDSADVQFSSIASVATLASVNWSPPAWTAEENSDDTSVDVTSLLQAFVSHAQYTPGRHAIFKIETLDTTTEGHYRTAYSFKDVNKAPYLDAAHVFDLAEIDSETGGFQSNKSYHFQFEFNDANPTRWVRIVTTDTPIKPNPILDLKKRLRFKMLLKSGSVYINLGIREVDFIAPVGSDGGISGTVEWVGVNSIIDDGSGNITPVGKLVSASNNWQEVDINIPKDPVVAFEQGNGTLASDFGVLEHLAFTVVPDSMPVGVYDIYIDKLEQVSDLLAAGTSQGIQVSTNFGTTWEPARLTSTPVHKFYKAINNQFVWAISADEVLLSVDPAFWFNVSGTTGVQYIRDIVEDINGNMFISTDKGVYWLEISLVHSFANFRQTQPVNAFSTECYGLYHNPVSSGIDEIWVSTEVGIYKTDNLGVTWTDTGMDTGGLVAYEIQNISSNTLLPNLIAISRSRVLRKLGNESNFSTIANLEIQHDIFDIWTMAFFANKLYISTGKGVYTNDLDILMTPSISDLQFKKVFSGLDINGVVRTAFCLDVVNLGDFGERLMIGQENRLVSSDEENVLGVRVEFRNKEIPSFFIDNVETTIGYIYGAFNNVLLFREPIQVNKIVTSAFLPRQAYIAVNGGWVQTNPEAEVFIYKNGIPTWLDWKLDEADILSNVQSLLNSLETFTALTSFNSLVPQSQTYLTNSINSITTIREGGAVAEGEDTGGSLINNATIIDFMNNYTRFLSLITEKLATDNDVSLPQIRITGMDRLERSADSRAGVLEAQENFTAESSVGINIDLVTGKVDFLTAFSQSTTPEDRDNFSFDKYDQLHITVFNSNISGSGEFTHRQLEDQMEDINTGLTSDLTSTAYTNLIKAGIFTEREHPFLFDRYNVSNIQSRFYAAHTNTWYDTLNSTLDYITISNISGKDPVRFVNTIAFINQEPYFEDKLWVGTDNDIVQISFGTDGNIIVEDTLRPGSGLESFFIWYIFIYQDSDIYVVASEKKSEKSHIFLTVNFGITWDEIRTINLPDKIFTFVIVNGIKIVTTEDGVFYSDNNFGTWFNSTSVLSEILGEDTSSTDAFNKHSFTVDLSTFDIIASDRWFFRSGNGIEFLSLGRLSSNSASVINKILRFKNLTWIATDKGLYDDGNTILSDSVQFGLQNIESDILQSAGVEVNDITSGSDALYCCSGSNIYRYLDIDPTDNIGNEWKKYRVPSFGSIHKIFLRETTDKHYLYVISYNKINFVDVTPNSGVFD